MYDSNATLMIGQLRDGTWHVAIKVDGDDVWYHYDKDFLTKQAAEHFAETWTKENGIEAQRYQ